MVDELRDESGIHTQPFMSLGAVALSRVDTLKLLVQVADDVDDLTSAEQLDKSTQIIATAVRDSRHFLTASLKTHFVISMVYSAR